ncbi:MAG: SRPBCC family protein [Hyphomonadaceae bacterium]
MGQSRFVYVTYIRSTPERLWRALTEPEFTRQYWGGTHQVSDWTKGSSWNITFANGKIADSGEVLEIDLYKKLVLKWRNEFMPEMAAEGDSRMSYTIEQKGEVVKLTLVHEMPIADSKLIDGVSQGWPELLASLKSLLETGNALPDFEEPPPEMAEIIRAGS